LRKIPTLYIARTADGIGLPLPSYTSRYHVGLNLQAAIPTAMRLEPGERVFIPSGFEIGIPDGYCGQVVSSSHLAQTQGLVVLGGPQIVHPADRGPLFLLLHNMSAQQIVLHRGDVVAQLLVSPVVQVAWHELTEKNALTSPTSEVDDLVLNKSELQEQEADEGDSMVSSPKRVYKSPRNRFSGGDSEDGG